MTAIVPTSFPQSADVDATYIARPGTSALFTGYVSQAAHLGGYQLPLVHHQVFGAAEATTETYRFMYYASPNASALAFYFLPIGTNNYGTPPEGTIAVAGADTTPLQIHETAAGVSDLGDLTDVGITFRRPVTAGALQEITYTVTDVRLHSVSVWEVPRAGLAGTDEHVDASFADANLYITDDEAANDPRGFKEVLNQVSGLRSRPCRHFTWFVSPGVSTTTASPFWGSLWANLRARARDVSNAATTRCSFYVYVSAVSAGSTWTVRLRDSATARTASITGINAAGSWWDTTGAGVSANIADGAAFLLNATAIDTLVVDAQRTAGGGGDSITVQGVSLIEYPA